MKGEFLIFSSILLTSVNSLAGKPEVEGTGRDLFQTLQRGIETARARRRGAAVAVGSGGVSNLQGIGYIDVFDGEGEDR